MLNCTVSEIPSMMPPRPASAVPPIQIIVITRRTSMPEASARSFSSATARIAVPSRVCSSNRPTPMSTTAQITMMT